MYFIDLQIVSGQRPPPTDIAPPDIAPQTPLTDIAPQTPLTDIAGNSGN